MNLAELSVKRPIFITCLVVLMLALGFLSLKRLPVDLFPSATFPIVLVNTVYPGAGPEEVETSVSRVLEEEVSTLPGIKSVRSTNREGLSSVIAEFTLETDVKHAEQQIRDRVGSAKRKLPDDIEEPVIRRIDPADQPVLILALTADLPAAQLYDLANEYLRQKFEQVNQVGLVEVIGGRKREIQVQLDRGRLKAREISVGQVASSIAGAGQNIPSGKLNEKAHETVFRTVGEFKSVADIGKTIVNFLGNDVPVTVADVGKVVDTLADEKSRAFVDGKTSMFIMIFRQSGANTIGVANAVQARMEQLNSELKNEPGKPALQVVRDTSKPIRANVEDVKESIFLGILLTIIVVYLFLGSGRSTIITGLALPNSLVGAFLLMAWAGFSINVMSLLALSLAVGLLVDDAIVVRENIFRHMEKGKSAIKAALEGTQEVALAVVATTFTVIAVFGPIGFLKGVVGQFFKEFGLTVCFAMAISLFDALTMAPMLSAYFAGAGHGAHGAGGEHKRGIWDRTFGQIAVQFGRFQDKLEQIYVKILRFTLRRPIVVLGGSFAVLVASLGAVQKVPKTFLPPQDMGEFSVSLEMPSGTTLEAMSEVAAKVDTQIRSNPEVVRSVLIVGGQNSDSNAATFFVELVPSHARSMNTSDFKERMREQLKPFADAKPVVKDIDMVSGGMRPFTLNIFGTDLAEIEKVARAAFEKLKDHPGLKDVEFSQKPGKPEFQVIMDNRRAEMLGVSTASVGMELRAQVEGLTPAVFREKGQEYDIRVRMDESQRNIREAFSATYVPNINRALVRLSDVAKGVESRGPATINRQDRGRYIQIAADVAPKGPGMGGVISDINRMFQSEIPLPPGMGYRFVGQAENFKELGESMVMAIGLGILFIYLVLASLYESFVTPFTIMLVLPLAACGAFFGLWVGGASLDIFSMIGCVMLLGIATKNSILLVDYTNQRIRDGVPMSEAIIEAGKNRLRPILMTTMALIAGMLPIAIGLNEASRQRTSMGIAVIGGLISSTLLTLVVVPAAFSYIERFRIWSQKVLVRCSAPFG